MTFASSNREFALVAACCRPLQDSERPVAVRDAAKPDLDWAHVERLSARHRVEGHVLDGLRSAGLDLPEEARPLAARFSAGAVRRLALTAETLRLVALFEAAGITVLCVKGASLEMLAYGRNGFKHSNDIDLLVAEGDLCRAEDLLADEGYVCEFPGVELAMRYRIDPAARRRFLRAERETAWRRGTILVEIHWRLADNRFLLQGLDVGAPRQAVELLPGRSVPTLARPDLFAFLALHGAHTGWCRLKWLADFVAFAARTPGDELTHMYERAGELRVGRCSAQALLLGERFLGLQLPSELARELRADRAVRAMVAFGTSALTVEVPAGRVDELPQSGGRLTVSHWRFNRHWAYRAGLIATSLRLLSSRVLSRWHRNGRGTDRRDIPTRRFAERENRQGKAAGTGARSDAAPSFPASGRWNSAPEIRHCPKS